MKKIYWTNGELLEAKKLLAFFNPVEELFSISSKHLGFNLLEIDEIQLQKGILKINKCECIFSNYHYIKYDSNVNTRKFINGISSDKIYEISIELKNFSLPAIFYLDPINEKCFFSEEVCNDFGDIITINFSDEKIGINDNKGMPFIKINEDFSYEYIAPMWFIQQTSLFTLIKNMSLEAHRKIYTNFKLASLINVLDLILQKNTTLERAYDLLYLVIPDLLGFIPVPNFDPMSLNPLKVLLDILMEKVIQPGQQKKMIYNDGIWTLPLPKFNHLTLFIDPVSIDFIEKANIYSSFFENIINTQRISGCSRTYEIINNRMIVKIGREYLKENDTLCIKSKQNSNFNIYASWN